MMRCDIFPTVAIRNAGRSPARLKKQIDLLLSELGVLDEVVKPGMTVLVKPDLDCRQSQDEKPYTHPELIGIVGRLLRKRGAKVLVGDSPILLQEPIESLWERIGLASVARREKLKLVSFEKAGTREVAVDSRVFYVSRPALEADLIVNMPRLRPNLWNHFSGAVRNLIGVVPGFQKGLHYKKTCKPEGIASVEVDVFSVVQPSLTIMDASVFGRRNVSNGRPSLLLASTDAVALDTVLADMVGIDPQSHHTIRIASEAGLGIGWIEAIRVLGGVVSSAGKSEMRLRMQGQAGWASRLFLKSVSPLIRLRAQFDHEKCRACHTCVNGCPTRALKPTGNGSVTYRPQFCICCWNCVTNCPSEAISIWKSPAAEHMLVRKRRNCAV